MILEVPRLEGSGENWSDEAVPLGGTIGFFQADPEAFLKGGATDASLDVEAKIAERKAAKAAKNYARSDEIRKELEAAGIVLEDKPGGVTEWRRK